MKKIYLFSFVVFTTILLILFVYYNRYRLYYEDEKTYVYISRNIDILDNNLNLEKQYALSLSLFISQNKTIKKALQLNNQKMALKEIDKFLQDIKESTSITNIDIQVHTENLTAFARNWDKSNYFGIKLSGFRKGLIKVQKTLKSTVSIELGKRLNIKAISPILDQEKKFMGSIEIIMDFKNIEKRISKFGLNMLPLLDDKFINVAEYLKNNQKINNYIISEKEYSKELYKILKNNPSIFKKDKFYYKIDGKIIVFVPMLSVGVEDVGYIVLFMNGKQDETYNNYSLNIEQENISYKFNQQRRKVIIK